MSITRAAAKAGSKVKQATSETTIAQKVDQLGDLEQEIVNLQAKIDKKVAREAEQMADLRKRLGALEREVEDEATDGVAPDRKLEVAGKRFVVKIGACRKKTSIVDREALIEALGEHATELAHYQIGEIKDYVPLPIRKKILKEEHEGARSFSVEPIG